jgi:ABC-type lipoprotein release transport system permease subunit
MGRLLLICRLAVGDVRHRPTSAVLLVLAIVTAATTLTLGLALAGTSNQPYQQTRALTAGPDVVADTGPGLGPPGTAGGPPANVPALTALTHASGVVAHSGPYPYTFATLLTDGHEAGAQVEGRDQAAAPVDQPKLTQGRWVRPGEVVLERSFADELGVGAGSQVTLNGRSFRVAGVAVTAASDLSNPQICFSRCDLTISELGNPGLVWTTRADAVSLATAAEPLSYTLNLKLADPADASAYANAYYSTSASAPGLEPWESIAWGTASQIRSEQFLLLIGSWLLGLLAVASVAVLVGGRMAEQTRRVGLLKAVGSTPGLVAAVLLAEHLVLAVVAAAMGLLIGWLVAPLLTSPGAALLGSAGAPPVTVTTIAIVVGVALAVAAVATLVPAIRAARTSTVGALADSARPPRRRARVIAVSARLPVPLLFGLRVAARRPRRVVLNTISIAVSVSGIVAVLVVHAHFDARANAGLADPQNARLSQVVTVISVALVVLAAVNVILLTWTTVLDTRHTSALARALGATPQQVSAGLSAAQVLPALVGALLGIPGGIGLVSAVNKDDKHITLPPLWWLVATVLATVAAVAAITIVPAWLGTLRPPGEVLQSETA